jgi:hypothetical protein
MIVNGRSGERWWPAAPADRRQKTIVCPTKRNGRSIEPAAPADRRKRLSHWVLFALLAQGWGLVAAEAPAGFRVKYVAEGVVYIDGGRAAGLVEAMKLTVRRDGQDVAELVVASVAEASAVCEIKEAKLAVQAGDLASLSSEDAQRSQILRAAGSGSHYAQTISFTDGDPLEEEIRDSLPRPKLPEINRIRGRIGFEYTGIQDQGGSGAGSSEFGLVLRADMTRIGGTYWNLSGYTRLRLTSSTAASQQPTLNDLLNRTYHMALTYQNPQSNWTAGFGRFYLPWASSLSTIDGGYLARRLSKAVTVGMFAGTTPDPTSWNYNPNREMAGTFISLEGGSYESFRYMSTTGFGVSRLSWKPEREFVFFENTFSWKRYFSVYHNLEADRSHATTQQPTASGTGIARSFLTLRFEPYRFLEFDLNENYFRSFPTFNPLLVGTGLLDKFLFQGVSGGVRLALPYHASVYVNLGRSKGNSDPNSSWNYLYGLSVADLLRTGIRADVHYSRFNSSFGQGNYQSLSLSRQMNEYLRLEVMAGQQNFASALTTQTRARFLSGNLDWTFARHYFLGGGLTVYRGQSQNYNQTFFTLGYRF